MDLIQYLRVIRRRWMLVVTVVALALFVVWFTLPAQGTPVSETVSYRATATLAANPTSEIQPNLSAISVFTTLGEVPERVAKQLDYDKDPQLLAGSVTTAVSLETGTLTITSLEPDAATAVSTANAFATELIAYFERDARRDARRQLDDVNRAMTSYAIRMNELDRQLAGNQRDSALVAERSGLQTHYEGMVAQAAALNDQIIKSAAPIELLQSAVAIPEASAGFTPPAGSRSRFLVGGGLGLLLGLALALVVEQLDSRVRTREQAEHAFGLPVLAEIPVQPWHRRRDLAVVSASEPGSATAEAYRALRSAVLLLRPDPKRAGRTARTHDDQSPSVILVTSARASEGKSSTVANLAIVMAESGRRVLVLSLDFRNPKIHEYLDAPSGTGLSDLLSANRPHDLERIVRETPFTGVEVATSGQETAHPGALLAGAGPLIDQARSLADVVLIDSAPLLAVSDAVDLSPHVDAALVVTRANRTTAAQARAADRLLSRLGVPALGAVLLGGSESASFKGYHARSSLSRQLANRLGVSSRKAPDNERPQEPVVMRATSSKDSMNND